MDDQQINVTLMTDSTDFLLLDNHDININSFYGDLKQLKNETRKLQADKEKEEEQTDIRPLGDTVRSESMLQRQPAKLQ